MKNFEKFNMGKCTGCGSCANICKFGAIKMVENKEGFLYPKIDEKLCVNCGACVQVCPLVNNNNINSKNPKCVAFLASDNIRKDSTSGGAFATLASYFIDNGGYVCGAVWNDNCEVEHIVSNKFEDIKRMKQSKYVQSNTNTCFKEIQTILQNGKKVLFSGCPCQVAGLKSFLKEEYDNLYCLDLICHGVPSAKVFKKYIKEEHIKNNDEVWVNTNFRDKCQGWSSALTTTTTTTTTTRAATQDSYMKAFLNNLSLRKSCAKCAFRCLPMASDMTIGDFWGVERYDRTLDDTKGTSILLLNNTKGEYLFDLIKNDAKLYKIVPLDNVIQGNPHLIYSDLTKNSNRKLFFELLEKKRLSEIVDICLNDKCDYLINNFWWVYHNYGAVLTAYAMQELVKSFGFVPKHINTGLCIEERKQTVFYDFVYKYLDTTNIRSLKDLKIISKQLRGCIIGSDQVLRTPFMYSMRDSFLLNFANNNCKKLAISASFGVDKQEFLKENCKKQINFYSHALSSFDYLSTREYSGTEILKDIFKLNSDMILDPVFLIDKSKFEKIAQTSTNNYANKVTAYVLGTNDKYRSVYNYFEQKYNTTVEVMNYNKNTVEDWLAAIKNCKFLITDSFHGACFAIIFNKPFICVLNKGGGVSRYESLIKLFGIESNFITNVDDIYTADINIEPDYSKINTIIDIEKERCLTIVGKVLCEGYSNNPYASKNKVSNGIYIKMCALKQFPIRKYLTYVRCRILANFTYGKKKEHYITKKKFIKRELENVLV